MQSFNYHDGLDDIDPRDIQKPYEPGMLTFNDGEMDFTFPLDDMALDNQVDPTLPLMPDIPEGTINPQETQFRMQMPHIYPTPPGPDHLPVFNGCQPGQPSFNSNETFPNFNEYGMDASILSPDSQHLFEALTGADTMMGQPNLPQLPQQPLVWGPMGDHPARSMFIEDADTLDGSSNNISTPPRSSASPHSSLSVSDAQNHSLTPDPVLAQGAPRPCQSVELYQRYLSRIAYVRANKRNPPVARVSKVKISETVPEDMRANMPWLADTKKSNTEATQVFRGYLTNVKAARLAEQTWKALHSQPRDKCTTPKSDPTFPNLQAHAQGEHDEQYTALVSQIFYAICDWREVSEWTQVIPEKARKELQESIHRSLTIRRGNSTLKGASIDDLRPPAAELARHLPDRNEQHRLMMGYYFPPDWQIELLSTTLLDAAISAQQGQLLVQPHTTADQG